MEEQIIKKLGSIDERLDIVARTVVDNQEQIKSIRENMATKTDLSDISGTLDELVGLAKKKDEELIFMGERVRRIEDKVKEFKPSSA